MNIELYYAPHCPRCHRVRQRVARLCAERGLALMERNVLEHLAQAAALGIRATPSLVIDGRLAASGTLEESVLQRLLTPKESPP